jgi:hypothetical protein
VEHVLTLTTQRVPREATHWSVALMASYAGITTWQVHQIWKAAGLKPHRLETFKISNDPEFADKVVDVVGLYMNPPDNALVLCVDEKTQIQALDRTQPGLPLSPGHVGSRTHDYKRNGTAALYAAFNILIGEVTGRVEHRSRAKEFLAFLRQIERATPRTRTCTSSSTTRARIKPRRSVDGWRVIRASTSISRPPAPPGSMPSKAGSRSSNAGPCIAESSPASRRSRPN